MTGLLAALATAGALGVTHAIEPDHVAGISSLTGRYADARVSALAGACFSLGHVALVLAWLAVGYAVLGRTEFPPGFEAAGTAGAGIVLGILGAVMAAGGVRRLVHAREHGDDDHSHVHVHLSGAGGNHDRPHGVRGYLGTGLVGALFTLSPPVSMMAFAATLFPSFGATAVGLAVATYAVAITATMGTLGAGVGATLGRTRGFGARVHGGARIAVGAVALVLAASLLAGTAGTLVTGVYGVVVERTIVRRLYGRLFDSMVATFGLGLIMTQGTRIALGNSLQSVGTPFGTVPGYTYSGYRVALAFVAAGVLVASYLVFTRTAFGVRARATIQDPETARAMGVDTDRMYTTTFGIGSGLAGLTGALYAPSVTMVPSMGESFLVESFVAVVVGGSSVLLGTTMSGGLLGSIDAIFSNQYGNFIGQMALLVAAIVAIRLLPDGLTGLVESIRNRLERRYDE